MKAFILALLVCSTYAKSILLSSRSGRIVGGNYADPEDFPYQALLQVKTATVTTVWGGSIISDRLVLTSAHCVDDALWVDVNVGVIRPYDANEPTRQTFRVQKNDFYVHEHFDPAHILNE